MANDAPAETAAPPPSPQGNPPSGAVTQTATCCPDVTTFDGSPSPVKVMGFDARSNLAQNRGADEYWIPPDANKTAPTDRDTQDGAAWASVGLGETTELELTFAGQSGNVCITNCRFISSDPAKVRVVTQRAASAKAPLVLEGTGEGETTIKVVCDGKDIGWVHVVCYERIVLDVPVGSLIGTRSREAGYGAANLNSVLNHVFKQALIEFSVQDIGQINMRDDPVFVAAEESSFAVGDSPYVSEGFGETMGQEVLVGPWLTTAANASIRQRVRQRTSLKLPLLYYVSTTHISYTNGSVPNIGSGPAYSYKDYRGASAPYIIRDSYAVLAHEIGHACGLYHPHQAPTSQLPQHLISSSLRTSNATIRDEPATNTEGAIVVGDKPVYADKNLDALMARDPLNLMGYWPVMHEQLYIRKLQWDTVRRGIRNYEGG